MAKPALSPVYVFIDEGGDFNFSLKGSKFYTFTAVITYTPWEGVEETAALRYQILSGELLPGLNQQYLDKNLSRCFHATEDKQQVRYLFFGIITKLGSITAHSIVVRKNKTNPVLYDPHDFYPKYMGSLVDYILKRYVYSKLCIFLSGTPIQNRKNAFLSAVKTEIKNKNPSKPFMIYFPPADSNLFLQVSDYINWAIFRKWERGDVRSYNLISNHMGTPELDIFQHGDVEYY